MDILTDVSFTINAMSIKVRIERVTYILIFSLVFVEILSARFVLIHGFFLRRFCSYLKIFLFGFSTSFKKLLSFFSVLTILLIRLRIKKDSETTRKKRINSYSRCLLDAACLLHCCCCCCCCSGVHRDCTRKSGGTSSVT